MPAIDRANFYPNGRPRFCKLCHAPISYNSKRGLCLPCAMIQRGNKSVLKRKVNAVISEPRVPDIKTNLAYYGLSPRCAGCQASAHCKHVQYNAPNSTFTFCRYYQPEHEAEAMAQAPAEMQTMEARA
jgi:hypothetical protein